jgi:arginine-tRNA-protein transferase
VERRNFPQFFITSPAPCPYLTGKSERKVFTHLINHDAQKLHDALSQGGFRRSQNIAYRPACDNCSACVSVRVPVATLEWTKSFRRSMRRNRDLIGRQVGAKATTEQYALFRSYIEDRHDDGGMADMTVLDFSSMVNESFVDTLMIEYRLPGDISLAGPERKGGELVACSLVDRLQDGLSMIYSFYAPDLQDRGLGTYMILDHMERARKLGLSYVYLGYWVADSPKMDYKARFLPQERLGPDGWNVYTK